MARRSIRRALALAAGVVAFAGCASQSTRAAAPGSQRSVLTADDLATVGDVNLHEALTRLRPQFLRGRMPASGGVQVQPVVVYLEGVRLVEGVENLRDIGAKGVLEVRFLEPAQANARFGGNNTGGALVITTKK